MNITGGITRLHVRFVRILEVNFFEVGVCLNPKVLFSEELSELFPQNISLPGSGMGHQKSIVSVQAYLVSWDQLSYLGQKV